MTRIWHVLILLFLYNSDPEELVIMANVAMSHGAPFYSLADLLYVQATSQKSGLKLFGFKNKVTFKGRYSATYRYSRK